MTDARLLTEKQRAFVAAYVGAAEGNATEAARLAGYTGSDKSLSVTGCRTLANANVQAALAVFRAATAGPLIMTATEAAERLSLIARGETTDQRIVGGKDDFVEAELRVQCSVQVDAIKTLSKMRGYDAPTKVEASVSHELSPEAEELLLEFLRVKADPAEWAAFQEWRATRL